MSRTGGGQHRPTPSPSEAPAQIQTTRFRLSNLPYTIISSHSRRSAIHYHIISLTHSLARVTPGVLYMVLHTSRPDDSSPSTTDRPTSLETELISEGVGRRTEAFSLRRRPLMNPLTPLPSCLLYCRSQVPTAGRWGAYRRLHTHLDGGRHRAGREVCF